MQGTQLMIPIYNAMVTSHNFEDPRAFKPERFEHATPFHGFLSFMRGPRTCIGKFETLQLKLSPNLGLLLVSFSCCI